jgi:hypothetical protein
MHTHHKAILTMTMLLKTVNTMVNRRKEVLRKDKGTENTISHLRRTDSHQEVHPQRPEPTVSQMDQRVDSMAFPAVLLPMEEHQMAHRDKLHLPMPTPYLHIHLQFELA